MTWPRRGPRTKETDRAILRLAVPALGALVAEPLYVLADTAVVGHIGTPQLAGLALASQVLLIIHAVFTFLAYGTTASVSRLLGAGQERRAAHQAVQGLWLAVGVGVVLATAVWLTMEPLLRLLGGRGETLANAETYLEISLAGLPAMLLMLAGVGYLRGTQDTVRPLIVALVTAAMNLVIELVLVFGFDLGIGASALSTVIVQWVGATMYVRWTAAAVNRHGVTLLPDTSVIAGLARAGVDLFVRTASLRGSFVVATAVVARIGTDDLAAHQITFEVFSFIALALDAVAIAGQALMGSLLGAGDSARARVVGTRIAWWGVWSGTLAGVAVLASRPVLPDVFTDDAGVVALTAFLFWFLAGLQPVNGLAFALDGVLIGAGDLRYLAWAMFASALAFVPLAIGVAVTDLGVGWLWGALCVFMVVRMTTVVVRFRGDAWMVTGAT